MTSGLRRLYEHLRWADEEARRAIETVEPGSEQRREAEITYAHVAASEEVWLARIEGRSPEHPVWPDLDLDEAGELAARTGDALERIARRIEDPAPERDYAGGDHEVVYTNSSGTEYRNRLEDVLLHVALHGAYHRGQLAHLVRRGGGTPNPTDYIVFLRGDPAPDHERPS